MGKVFFFASGNAIYNDKVIPIILELARQGNTVDTVLFGQYAYEYCSASGVYAHWLKTFTRLRLVVMQGKPTVVERIIAQLRGLFFLIEMMMRKGYIVFFDPKMYGSRGILGKLNKIANRRGRLILYSANYIDTWGTDINWDLILHDDAVCNRLKGVTYKEYRKRASRQKRVISCSGVLVYNRELLGQGDSPQYLKQYVVPHPKLQSWWGTFCQANPPLYDDSRLMSETQWISIFLTYKGNYIFRDDSDLDALVPEIVQCIRSVFPSMLIVIKPKVSKGRPLAVQEEALWLERCMKEFKDENVIVSTSPVALLARKSLAGISTGHGTAQFEFQIGLAPWIDYCRYSDFWKKIYPKVTYTEEYGGYWAQTPEELTAFLRKVKAGQLKNDLEAFKKKINFYEQNISFDFFTT